MSVSTKLAVLASLETVIVGTASLGAAAETSLALRLPSIPVPFEPDRLLVAFDSTGLGSLGKLFLKPGVDRRSGERCSDERHSDLAVVRVLVRLENELFSFFLVLIHSCGNNPGDKEDPVCYSGRKGGKNICSKITCQIFSWGFKVCKEWLILLQNKHFLGA